LHSHNVLQLFQQSWEEVFQRYLDIFSHCISVQIFPLVYLHILRFLGFYNAFMHNLPVVSWT
jgi:hypothetical protein